MHRNKLKTLDQVNMGPTSNQANPSTLPPTPYPLPPTPYTLHLAGEGGDLGGAVCAPNHRSPDHASCIVKRTLRL